MLDENLHLEQYDSDQEQNLGHEHRHTVSSHHHTRARSKFLIKFYYKVSFETFTKSQG